MTKEEYNQYLGFIISNENRMVKTSDSPHEVSELRIKASVYLARLGHELALIKDRIEQEFLVFSSTGMTNAKAQVAAEVKVNQESDVSRRQIDYLREAMQYFSNSCASRLNVLNKEI